jgi:hypothetical protein
MADLDALLASAKVAADARVLVIGRPGQAAKNQIDLALENPRGPYLSADDESADGERLAGDSYVFDLPGGAGICFVTPALSRIPDAFEELLPDILSKAMRPGGVVALQFCRDASDAAFDRLKTHANVRVILRDFLKNQFGAEVVGADAIARKFASDGAFEFLGIASRTHHPAEEEPIVWVVLRRRAGDGAGAFPRTQRADRFPQADLSKLAARLKDSGIAFLPVDEFAQRLGGAPGAFGLIKLDIHRSIRRTPEVGELLRAQGVRALFLMMHRHPLTDDYYDAPLTWKILRDLGAMGHEVGLHLDPFDLIRKHGDLNAGVAAALEDMRGRGLTIRAATLHGDTSAHIRARSLFAFDFFRETGFRSTWDFKPPDGEPIFAEHVGRYSFEGLARDHGLRYFAEANFVADGTILSTQPLAYLSDNRRTMALLNTPGGEINDAAPFRISDDFASRAADALKAQPFLALFHPQWMW